MRPKTLCYALAKRVVEMERPVRAGGFTAWLAKTG